MKIREALIILKNSPSATAIRSFKPLCEDVDSEWPEILIEILAVLYDRMDELSNQIEDCKCQS